MPRTSKVNHEEFIRLWNDGIRAQEMADKLGISESYVRHYARIHREECYLRKGKVNLFQKEEFDKLWEEGVPIQDIAKRLKITINAAMNWVKSQGYKSRRRNKIDEKTFAVLWEEGVTEQDIGKLFGVTNHAVCKYAKRKGYPPRRICERKIKHNEFVEMWNNGIAIDEIAKAFDVTEKRVRQYASEHSTSCHRRIDPRIPKDRHEEFVKLWNEGFSTNEMAREFGVGKLYIAQYAEENRDVCPSRSSRTKIVHEEFVKLWNAGVSAKEIGQRFGVGEMRVFHYVKEHRESCPKRKLPSRSKIDHEEFVKLWNEGVLTKDIAVKFGVDKRYISAYACKHRDECIRRR